MTTMRGFSAAETRRRAKVNSTFMERAMDAVVGMVRPRDTLIRQHRRLMERDGEYRDNWLQLVEARGYKSATNVNNATPWLHATSRNADAELNQDLATMRARGRQLERDDSLASGLIATRRRQVVGAGLRPQANTEEGDTLNDVLEAVFEKRRRTLFPGEGDSDFAQGVRTIYTRRFVDGDILVVRTKLAPDEPVWFELVEGDRLDTPLDALPGDPEGRIINGIEKDRYGRLVAYWVAKRHPGEVQFYKTTGAMPKPVALTKADFVRIPKDRARLFRHGVSRPGQTRGVPGFHASMQDFLDLDLLTLSLLKRSQVAACVALFIQSEQDVSNMFSVTTEDYGYQLDQALEPGMIFKLYPGESVQGVSPGVVVPDVAPMQLAVGRRIATAAEMSPEAVLKEWGATNYSSARTVQIEDNRSYDVDRHDLASQGLDWMWEQVLLDAQLMGDPDLAGVDPTEFTRVRWVGDARPWVDPGTEAQAVMLRLSLGLTCLRDEAEALGKDWEELLEQQGREMEKREKIGLPEPEGLFVQPPPEPEAAQPAAGGKKPAPRARLRSIFARAGLAGTIPDPT